MTNSQKRFCDEYLIDFNATRAYKAAYKSCRKDETANVNGSKLLRNTKVQEYIAEKQQEMQERNKITQDTIIQELAKIALFNIKDIYNEDGTLKKVTELDDDTAKAISGVKILQKAGAMKIILSKTNDKTKALELLGKHLGMFKENVNLTQDKPFEVNINVKKKN
ncbi:MAG: terminase small subunit [Clostridia bacterium]|jgi:phage terminase small subunit|nr:MAG TPA: Terminase small subunit [Caudoviricetes sp.]